MLALKIFKFIGLGFVDVFTHLMIKSFSWNLFQPM